MSPHPHLTPLECYTLLLKNSASSQPPTLPSLQNTFGAFLICTFLGCMLFGLTAHQTYRYFRLYPGDLLGMKVFVGLLLTLDLLHSMTSIHACYHYLVNNYFNPCSLDDGVWSIRIGVIETALMILISHCFYARRLYLLGGNTFLPVVIIGVLLVVEMGFSIAATSETFIQWTFSNFKPFMWLIWVVLLAALLVDVTATSILTYYLRQNRTGFKKTDSIIDVLIVYAINTGLSTSIITLAAFVSSIASRDTLIWAAVTVVGTKMYANSLLAVVNSRRSIVDKGLEGFETGSFGLKVIDRRPGGVLEGNSGKLECALPQAVIGVKVTQETFIDISDRSRSRSAERPASAASY